MKKLSIMLISLFVLCSSVFAGPYVIKEVVGSVTYEVSTGKFATLKEGMELEASTMVKTGLNSSIKVEFEGKIVTVRAKQKNTIQILFIDNVPLKSGLKKQTIAKADFADNATGKREGVATASSRASEAKEDFEWDE